MLTISIDLSVLADGELIIIVDRSSSATYIRLGHIACINKYIKKPNFLLLRLT